MSQIDHKAGLTIIWLRLTPRGVMALSREGVLLTRKRKPLTRGSGIYIEYGIYARDTDKVKDGYQEESGVIIVPPTSSTEK